jgi:hypothetical protein
MNDSAFDTALNDALDDDVLDVDVLDGDMLDGEDADDADLVDLLNGAPDEEVTIGSIAELEALGAKPEPFGAVEADVSPVEIALRLREHQDHSGEDVSELPPSDTEEDEPIIIRRRTSAEFLCLSCFIITPKSRCADTKAKICADCS